MQVMKVSFPAPKQDGEELGGCRGARGAGPALPPPPGAVLSQDFQGTEGERKEAGASPGELR